jgi:hypothetical protein
MFLLFIATGLLGISLIFTLYLLLISKSKQSRILLFLTSLILLLVNITFWVLLIGYAK